MTNVTANAPSAIPTYGRLLSSESAMSVPSVITRTSVSFVAVRASVMLSIVLSVRDWRRIGMGARRSSILVVVGLIW